MMWPDTHEGQSNWLGWSNQVLWSLQVAGQPAVHAKRSAELRLAPCRSSVEELQAAEVPAPPAEPFTPTVEAPLAAVPPLAANGSIGVSRTIEVDVSDTSDQEDDSLKVTNIALSPQTVAVCSCFVCRELRSRHAATKGLCVCKHPSIISAQTASIK
jgi:hypothetical protein